MRSPTIRDVAKRAGVGVGTVSRVLNGSPQVREETRQKVLTAIRELGYSPNAAARQLSGGKTFTIGVVTAFFTFPSFVERLTGIQEVLDESSYDLVLYSIRSLDQLHRRLRLLATQNRVDGLIILSLPFSEQEMQRMNPGLPILAVDNSAVEYYPHIMIDNLEGGQRATEYLIEKGHRSIGFIGDPAQNTFGFTSTRHRFLGFQQALEQAGLEFNPDWCQFGEYSQETGRNSALHILQQNKQPTALFVATDNLAFGALSAAHELGLRVPDDVAIIGFDDIQAARYVRLTSVHQPLAESGRQGAQRMLDWLRTGYLEPYQWETKLPLEIIERDTV